jgi:hypothetical protein
MRLRNRWQVPDKEIAGWPTEAREFYYRVIVPDVLEELRNRRRERWTAGAVKAAIPQILLAVAGVLIALITLYDGLSWLGDGSGWTSTRWLGGDGVWESAVRLLILITLTVIVVKSWPQVWRDRFNAIVAITLISGFLALMLADGMLQRYHHPVKLPLIGWIGDPKPPADPGDYDGGY